MKKTSVNRYWVVNLWEAVDGESIEIDGSVDDYLGLDVSDDTQLDKVVDELLLPHLRCFSDEDQERIRNSLFYDSRHLPEEELLRLMNFLGGTVFGTPNERVSTRELYDQIGRKLFENYGSAGRYEYEDTKDVDSYRFEVDAARVDDIRGRRRHHA